MFVNMICERLAAFNTSDNQRTPNRTPAKTNVRETELTSDNDNEQRLIQRGDSDDPDFDEPWDEENSIPPEVSVLQIPLIQVFLASLRLEC
jgi:hypothetical protein